MNLIGKAKTAVRHPDRVPPFVAQKAIKPMKNGFIGHIAHERTKRLPAQGSRLDDLRNGESWMLIVLDACRYDYFNREFVSAFGTDDEILPVRSEARDTFEWLSTVWAGSWSMPYVSGAVPVNDRELDFEDEYLQRLYGEFQPTDHLHDIRSVWREGWDASLGTCPPEPVVEAVRETNTDRVVAHIQQPHTPYIGKERELGHADDYSADPLQGEPTDKPIWKRVERGDISDIRLGELYRSNLQRTRDSLFELVSLGLERHDRVAITADHGEALGEFGIYAHPRTPEHPMVRRIPWVEVTDIHADWKYFGAAESQETEMPVQERLEALGYR